MYSYVMIVGWLGAKSEALNVKVDPGKKREVPVINVKIGVWRDNPHGKSKKKLSDWIPVSFSGENMVKFIEESVNVGDLVMVTGVLRTNNAGRFRRNKRQFIYVAGRRITVLKKKEASSNIEFLFEESDEDVFELVEDTETGQSLDRGAK